MIKKLKNMVAIIATLGAFSVPAFVPAVVSAQGLSSESPDISNGLCAGTNLDATQSNGCDPASSAETATSQVNNIIKLVINLFSLIVGVVSVIMIIVGGLKYITSGGESSNISSAKNTIVYAIIGLVIVALAQFIVHFVLGKVAVGQ
jgi:cytochrome bd-type quinol oxidase subunit 2